jgi:hypothetical protein
MTIRPLLAAVTAVLLFQPLVALADGCARASQASVVHARGSTAVEWLVPLVVAGVLGFALIRRHRG